MYKVEVNINDSKLFRIACFYLDNKEVLNYIFHFRERNSLLNRHIKSIEFDKWVNENRDSIKSSSEVSNQINRRLEEMESDNSWWGKSTQEEINEKMTIIQLAETSLVDREIQYIGKKFYVSKNRAWIIFKATICNEVTDADFKLKNKVSSSKTNLLIKDEEIHTIPIIYKNSQKSRLIRDRKWYWERVMGKTYTKISHNEEERGEFSPEDYENNVKQGIRRYRQFLGVQNSLI